MSIPCICFDNCTVGWEEAAGGGGGEGGGGGGGGGGDAAFGGAETFVEPDSSCIRPLSFSWTSACNDKLLSLRDFSMTGSFSDTGCILLGLRDGRRLMLSELARFTIVFTRVPIFARKDFLNDSDKPFG